LRANCPGLCPQDPDSVQPAKTCGHPVVSSIARSVVGRDESEGRAHLKTPVATLCCKTITDGKLFQRTLEGVLRERRWKLQRSWFGDCETSASTHARTTAEPSHAILSSVDVGRLFSNDLPSIVLLLNFPRAPIVLGIPSRSRLTRRPRNSRAGSPRRQAEPGLFVTSCAL